MGGTTFYSKVQQQKELSALLSRMVTMLLMLHLMLHLPPVQPVPPI